MAWRTRIMRWDPPRGFVDNQERGPYRLWWHIHRIEPASDGGDGDNRASVMVDRVYYTPPLGPLGRLAHALFIKHTLRAIFAYRAHCVARLFGHRRDREHTQGLEPAHAVGSAVAR